jgi:hypothetical protein
MASPLLAGRDEKVVLRPVQVGRGPLLVFDVGGYFVRERLYVFDPQTHSKPQLLSTTPYTLTQFHRLERDVLLIGGFNDVYQAKLSRGTIEPILPGTRLNLLEGERPRFYLYDEHASPMMIVSARVQPYLLYVMDTRQGRKPLPLSTRPVEKILATTPDAFWVIRAEPAELWKIARDGSGEQKVFQFQTGLLPSGFTHAFSPDGSRLAVGVGTLRQFLTSRDLLVIHLPSGRRLFSLERIPLQLTSVSSHIPLLRMRWLDDHRLRYSETKITEEGDLVKGYQQWVDVHVSTGKRLQERPYTKSLGMWHKVPPDDTEPEPPGKSKRQRVGLFEMDGDALYYGDAREPVTASWREVAGWTTSSVHVERGGRWAAVVLYSGGGNDQRRRLYVVDGEKRAVRYSTEQSVGSVTWLPQR